jgi:DNA-binding response OmpR family regulator
VYRRRLSAAWRAYPGRRETTRTRENGLRFERGNDMYLEAGGFMQTGAGVRVLVIDDEPSVADALKMILEDYGYGVAVAMTGREGIEQARCAEFDVIITDLRLPDADGMDIIAAAREGGMKGLVILITSHGTREIFARALARGADGVVAKPFRPADIIRLITAARGRSGPGDA